MSSNDSITSESEPAETIIVSEIEYKLEKPIGVFIPGIESQDISICQELFAKLEHFKQETTTLSTVENNKELLNQSISLWNELWQMANYANQEDTHYFDIYRGVVVKIFMDINETDLFNNDTDFSREKFFDYLDLLNRHGIQQLAMSSSTNTLADVIIESNMHRLLYILSTLCDSVVFIDSDMNNKYSLLLNVMRDYVGKQLQSTTFESSTNEKLTPLYQCILLFLWHLSDHTIVVPYLLHAGYGKNVIEWLKHLTLTDAVRQPVVNIVFNLARHDDGADELNKYEAIQTIKQMEQSHCVRERTILLLNTMILALLSTPNQIKADPTGTNAILDQLLQIAINASTAEKYRCNGFHISEPLVVLVKLFVDDITFDYVMNHAKTTPPSNPTYTVKLFSNLLISFYATLPEKNHLEQFTFIALSNILWSISFHEVYHELLTQHTELMNIMQNVALYESELIIEQYVPRSMQNVKKAADGILFNLGLEISVASMALPYLFTEQQQQQHQQQKKPLVMLSYSHTNSSFCDKILELLDQKADLLDIWIDKRFCKSSGDVWESIARGIKNSDLIICIVSSEYLASKACRQEVIYAKDRLNKRFLPVYLGRPEISEWLDIRLAEYKYVRFQNTHLPLKEDKVEEFLSTVIESIPPEYQPDTNLMGTHHRSSPIFDQTITIEIIKSDGNLATLKPTELIDKRNKSVLAWTQDDIYDWFAQHDICPYIRDMYQFKTGAQMIAYAECVKDEWQKQYDRYAPRYARRYPHKELLEHEFALFISALRQLSGRCILFLSSGDKTL
ncbi:unnamed protein product [Rotaria magnacalcarata]|uniref:TIR domain-containing protein n=2 Tax=Rotaria magnacalcarata TaxID=392030 RepID=A0A816Q7Y0_9BILA|nr:unnamed protein product [Rotaria magnacalcarata]CAF2058454.1 unnamed protein product [Rotaria magnacalcarata]CAF3746179.1 unnamed protein product [Rotaria magnacalcarata]CAF4248353.1 unnamed protein product [Rotaria magnacalcarata]